MKSKSKIFYVTPLDVVKDPGSGKPPEKSNDDIDDLMNLKFDKTPQIFKDCIPILFLARLIRIHPISYEKERELKGICPLTFSWKSWESLIAYIQFAALVVLGLISTSINVTLSFSALDLIGAVSKGLLCDTVLALLIVIFSMKNTPKVLVILMKFAKFDLERTMATTSKTASKWKTSLKWTGCLFLLFVSFHTVLGYRVGAQTCDLDVYYVVEKVLGACQVAKIINAIFFLVQGAALAIQYIMFSFLLHAFADRLDYVEMLLDEAVKDRTTNIGVIKEKLDWLKNLLADIFECSSIPLVLRFAYAFISALTLLYFTKVVVDLCSYQLAAVLAISAILEVIIIYMFIRRCQATLDKIDALEEGLELDAGGKKGLGQECTSALMKCTGKMKEQLHASQYFSLNKSTFLAFVNALATYLVIMLQIDIATIEFRTNFCNPEGDATV